MVAIRNDKFGGIAPKLNARYLPEDKSQLAFNVDTTRQGALTPTYTLGPSLRGLGFTPKSLFRYKENYLVEDEKYWVASRNDTDFCSGQITKDTSEILYFTDSTSVIKPQFTFDIHMPATDSGLLYNLLYGVDESYDLGVPKPTLAPSLTTTPPAEIDGLTVEFRTYIFTYVWEKAGREMESAPSPASDIVEVYLDSGQVVTVNTLVSSPPYNKMANGEVTKRIYRAVSGSFFFVTEIPVTQQSFADTIEAEDLAEELPSLTWDVPDPAMIGLTNMANGIMAGFKGRDIYFCEPYVPHAWPINYSVTVESPVVALVSLDTTLVVLTKERPYFIQGSDPSFMTVVEGDIAQGCLSKRSAAALNGEVYYTSPDGLVATSPRGSRIVTESMFSYRQWNEAFDPTSVHGYVHDLKYFGYYQLPGSSVEEGVFIYDIPSRQFTLSTETGVAGYTDLRVDKMYMVNGNGVKAWGDGVKATYQWKSKMYGMPSEVSFSCFQVEAESYPIDYIIYTDGTQLQTGTVTSRNMLRLKSILARDWEIELTGTGEVFNVALAQSGSELANV